MRHLATFWFICAFTVQLGAQHPATPFADMITGIEMKETVSILASDALEGRLTASRGQKMAASFLQYEFQKAGLRSFYNDFRQTFQLYAPNYSGSKIHLNGQVFKNFEDFVFIEPWTKEQSTSVVFVGKGTDRDFAGIDLNGKSALVWLDAITPATATAIALRLTKAGAAAALFYPNVRAKEFDAFAATLKRSLVDDRFSLEYPTDSLRDLGVFYIHDKIASELGWPRSRMEKAGRGGKGANRLSDYKIKFESLFSIDTVDTENVVGYIEGTDKKDEFVIITAHYDHIGIEQTGEDRINNGADDDASGTAAVLQLARTFAAAKKNGHGPRRSILFMTFTAEEWGLYGSEYYVRHPLVPLYKTITNLNIDMVGRVDATHANQPDYVYVIGADKLSKQLHQISESANQQSTQLHFDYTYNDENHPSNLYRRSDHWNFAQFNIPIIFYFDGIHSDYHLPSDEALKIEYELLAKRTKCIFYTAWEIANREDRLKLD